MDKDIVLRGDLAFINLGELLQLLGTNSATGILRIKAKYAKNPGLIYFLNGNPVNASSGSFSGIDALYKLFGWIDGEFEFSNETITAEKKIMKNRMELILNGLRMLDEGQIEKLGPVSYEKSVVSDRVVDIPLIKGPLVDHTYVIEKEEFYDSQKIVLEGGWGNWIWVVLDGVVEITKETPDGILSMLRVADGAYIGSIDSLSMEGNVRSATAVAIGDVRLGVLDSERLHSEYMNLSPELRGVFKSMDKRLRQVTDRAVDIYSGRKMLENFVKGRKPVMKQGDGDERIFEITQGTASIVRFIENGYVLLANLHEGDFIGHIPFMNIGHEPYSASVLASTKEFKAKKLDPQALQEEYNQLSSTLVKILEHVATCISVTSLLATEYEKNAKIK